MPDGERRPHVPDPCWPTTARSSRASGPAWRASSPSSASATTGGLNYDSNFADSSQVTAERGEAEALAGELKEALVEVEAAIAGSSGGPTGSANAAASRSPRPASRPCRRPGAASPAPRCLTRERRPGGRASRRHLGPARPGPGAVRRRSAGPPAATLRPGSAPPARADPGPAGPNGRRAPPSARRLAAAGSGSPSWPWWSSWSATHRISRDDIIVFCVHRPLDHPPRDLPRLGGPRLRRRHRQAGRAAHPEPDRPHRPDRHASSCPVLMILSGLGFVRVGQAGAGQRLEAAQPAQRGRAGLAGRAGDEPHAGVIVARCCSTCSTGSRPDHTPQRPAARARSLFYLGLVNIWLARLQPDPDPAARRLGRHRAPAARGVVAGVPAAPALHAAARPRGRGAGSIILDGNTTLIGHLSNYHVQLAGQRSRATGSGLAAVGSRSSPGSDRRAPSRDRSGVPGRTGRSARWRWRAARCTSRARQPLRRVGPDGRDRSTSPSPRSSAGAPGPGQQGDHRFGDVAFQVPVACRSRRRRPRRRRRWPRPGSRAGWRRPACSSGS